MPHSRMCHISLRDVDGLTDRLKELTNENQTLLCETEYYKKVIESQMHVIEMLLRPQPLMTDAAVMPAQDGSNATRPKRFTPSEQVPSPEELRKRTCH
jgi:hypothetical protein